MRLSLMFLLMLMAVPVQAATNPAALQGLNNELGAVSNTMLQGGQTVAWGQNSISYSQVQSLIAANPGVSQLNIQFPNGANWAVQPTQLQSLYQNYAQRAQLMGVNPNNLSFSSLPGASGLSIPINNAMGSMQQALDASLQQLRYEQLNLSDQLPDWLKNAIVWVLNALSQAYAWLVQVVGPYLPSWLQNWLQNL